MHRIGTERCKPFKLQIETNGIKNTLCKERTVSVRAVKTCWCVEHNTFGADFAVDRMTVLCDRSPDTCLHIRRFFDKKAILSKKHWKFNNSLDRDRSGRIKINKYLSEGVVEHETDEQRHYPRIRMGINVI